jgi:hypothetical protein
VALEPPHPSRKSYEGGTNACTANSQLYCSGTACKAATRLPQACLLMGVIDSSATNTCGG